MESIAWLLLALLGVALLAAYIKGGFPEVGRWLHSRFIGGKA
jgi:hypothetical protein